MPRIKVGRLAVKAIVFAAICLLLLTSAAASAQKPLVVLYAFDAEGEVLARQMTIDSTERILGRTVRIGLLSGRQVVLAESGVGMTNAAMTTQRLIDRYQPVGVVFSGIAGAIDTAVHIGDICVCDSWATHDYVYEGREETKPMPVWIYEARADSVTPCPLIRVDSVYLASAKRIDRAKLHLQVIGTRPPQIIIGGTGVSGNAFIDNADKRVWLQQKFAARVTDMESAAVAQVCFANGVPFIIIRSASDLAGGSAGKSAGEELDLFFRVAAGNSASLVTELIRMLP